MKTSFTKFTKAIQIPARNLAAKSDLYGVSRYRHPDNNEWIIVTLTGHHIRAKTIIERYITAQTAIEFERTRNSDPIYRRHYWK